VGAGSSDTTIALGTFIGGGSSNVADTGLTDKVGNYASIPGGDNLKTQSYSQTALGFYNLPGGSTLDDTDAQKPAHVNDPLLIVGNGQRDLLGVPRRSNAFTISNNGHSVVFGNNGSSDTGIVSPGALPPIYGARYQDNTISAWGDIPDTDRRTPGPGVYINTSADFGVAHPNGVEHEATGVYVITINVNDPVTNAALFPPLSHVSISVTPQDDTAVSRSSGCIEATCSKFYNNQFIVRTYSNCIAKDEAFYFQLVGRP